MRTNELNYMQCDPETGVCEVPGFADKKEGAMELQKKPVRLLYFTDPICSTCWGIEPQLRKLKLEYGDYFDIEYRMGGLLKGWDSYGGSDVSNPADVAQHWDEVSQYFDMPIDGDVWLEDPLQSSYPPSIAFKAAQVQDEQKAVRFLRKLREMVFVEKRNITRWEHLSQAAAETGLDLEKFKEDYENRAKDLFNEDLEVARQWGVRGFPTIYFIDEEDNRFRVYGSKPYEQYEQALLKLVPKAVKKALPSSETILNLYDSVTTKELSELTNQSKADAGLALEKLAAQQQIEKVNSKNGPLWKRVN